MPNYVDPDTERFALVKGLDRDHPIHMLNLVRLKAEAIYEDGTKTTGREAYAAYGRESLPVLQRVGGGVVWSGDFELTLIGPDSERWDIAFIAEYPSGRAFIEMLRDPEYRAAVKHRQSAVETSRLIRMRPKPVGLVSADFRQPSQSTFSQSF
jgi:uncharacterized protein (DUF1330 family)